jgi:hypothetical protein
MALQFPPLAFHRGSIIELGWNFSSRRPKVVPPASRAACGAVRAVAIVSTPSHCQR